MGCDEEEVEGVAGKMYEDEGEGGSCDEVCEAFRAAAFRRRAFGHALGNLREIGGDDEDDPEPDLAIEAPSPSVPSIELSETALFGLRLKSPFPFLDTASTPSGATSETVSTSEGPSDSVWSSAIMLSISVSSSSPSEYSSTPSKSWKVIDFRRTVWGGLESGARAGRFARPNHPLDDDAIDIEMDERLLLRSCGPFPSLDSSRRGGRGRVRGSVSATGQPRGCQPVAAVTTESKAAARAQSIMTRTVMGRLRTMVDVRAFSGT